MLYESFTIFTPWGRSAFLALSPRQGRQNWIFLNFHMTVPKFWCHRKSYPAVQLFLKRIDRHNECIPGYVVTWSRLENCSEINWTHRFRDIFIFVIHLHHFLTSLLDLDFPCRCITLWARKALRVIYVLRSWGRRPVRVLSPRQGRPTWRKC